MSIRDWFKRSENAGLKKQVKALQSYNLGNSITNLTTIFPTYSAVKEVETYRTVDDLYSIITFLAETSALIPFYGYKVVKDKEMKRYKNATGVNKLIYRLKALEDLPDNNPTVKLLESMTFEEKVSYYLSLYLCGEVFLLKEVVELGPNRGNTQLTLLPPQFINLVISNEFPQEVVKYQYQDSKFNFVIEAEDIIHIKYTNPDPYTDQRWRGFSPVAALKRRITRATAGMDASVAQLQNGGLPGVIYEKDLDSSSLGKRREDFGNYQKNSNNKSAPYWIEGDIGYIQVGSPLADLEVAAISDIDFKKFCNAFRFPSQLLNNDKASTDNNMEWAEKRLYTNAVLPNVYRLRDGLNKGLGLKEKGEYIEADISDINALQDDMKTTADALNIIDFISPNEKREIMKFDRSDDPLMDEIIVATGKMLLSDLEFVDDVEPTKDYVKPNGKNR